MSLYKRLCLILDLIGLHLIGDRSFFLIQKCIDIQCTVAVKHILSAGAKIHTRCDQIITDLFKLRTRMVCAVQYCRCCNDWGSQRSSLCVSVCTAHLCRIHTSRCYDITVVTIVGIRSKLPVRIQCSDTDHVLIGSRIIEKCRAVITCSRHADHITVHRQLRIITEDIFIRHKGHVYHIRICFDRIRQTKDQIRCSEEVTLGICITLDHKQLCLRCYTGNTFAIHRRTQCACHARSMPLLILDHRHVIILDDLVIGSIIGQLADPPLKLLMIRIDTGINDGYRHSGTLIALPSVLQVQIAHLTLLIVVRITHFVIRTRLIQLMLVGIHCARLHMII